MTHVKFMLELPEEIVTLALRILLRQILDISVLFLIFLLKTSKNNDVLTNNKIVEFSSQCHKLVIDLFFRQG